MIKIMVVVLPDGSIYTFESTSPPSWHRSSQLAFRHLRPPATESINF